MPRRAAATTSTSPTTATPTPPPAFPTPALHSRALRMTYRIARGEQGVLTFEPYKSFLLPHWRFRTLALAQASSATLYSAFGHYVRAGDFVGADMARKFVQMGMTRARRYANYRGGRKYARSRAGEGGRVVGEGRVQLAKSEGHEGREEKARASEVFEGVWRWCTGDEGYVALKGAFQAELKAWEREVKRGGKGAEGKVGDESGVTGEEVDGG
ncbi:hypothetical protein LTR08_007435 [Meristemomyces frigidus]|nr:hypothetical protein LTR08_007435 [Meristemomyces frigidus]